MLPTRRKGRHVAPMRHPILNTNVSKTLEKFSELEEAGLVYVAMKRSESSVNVEEPSRKSRTKKKNLCKVLKNQAKTVSVKVGDIHSRISNNRLLPAQRKSGQNFCFSKLLVTEDEADIIDQITKGDPDQKKIRFKKTT